MTKTTQRQDKDFQEQLFDAISDQDILSAVRDLLNVNSSWVLDWVAENFNPDDVFTDDDLERWAKEHGYTHEG